MAHCAALDVHGEEENTERDAWEDVAAKDINRLALYHNAERSVKIIQAYPMDCSE